MFPYLLHTNTMEELDKKIGPSGVHVFTMRCRGLNQKKMLHSHAVSNHGTMVGWARHNIFQGVSDPRLPIKFSLIAWKKKKNLNSNNNLNVQKIFCFSTRLEFLFKNVTNIIYVNIFCNTSYRMMKMHHSHNIPLLGHFF